jgi:hypothetical protein
LPRRILELEQPVVAQIELILDLHQAPDLRGLGHLRDRRMALAEPAFLDGAREVGEDLLGIARAWKRRPAGERPRHGSL